MPESVLDQIKILDQAPVSSIQPEPTDLGGEIKIFQGSRELTRVNRERPRQENITYLGERDDHYEEVLIEPTTLNEMTDSLRSNLEVELGGVLVGYYCQDASGRRFTQITGFIPAHHGVARGGTFTFTPDSWSQMIRDQETRGKGEKILGWVHSHPSYGYPPDPSGYDEFIMKHFFNEPERLTLILGRGGAVDNHYGLYRWEPDGARSQKGIGVVGATKETVDKYGYFSKEPKETVGEEIAEAKVKKAENWFRKSIGGILDLLGIKLTDRAKLKLYETLSITPDDLVDEIMEIVVSEEDDTILQRKLTDSIRIIKESQDPERELIRISEEELKADEPEDVMKITEADIEATALQQASPEPTIKIEEQDLTP